MFSRLPGRLLTILLFSLVYGCAAAGVTSTSKPVNSKLALSGDNITGVWQGRSFADCPIVTTTNPGRCGAMQQITLTLFYEGGRISGSYKCAFCNENCRDLAETGIIRNGEM